MSIANSNQPTTSKFKRQYREPAIIDVGSIATVTNGHSTPVGDPPHDGTTGWYNAAGSLGNVEVDLDD